MSFFRFCIKLVHILDDLLAENKLRIFEILGTSFIKINLKMDEIKTSHSHMSDMRNVVIKHELS